MKENLSPEERLLHIIKGANKKEKPPLVKAGLDEAGLPKALKERVVPSGKSIGFELKYGSHRDIARKIFILKRVNIGLLIALCFFIAGIAAIIKNLRGMQIADIHREDETPENNLPENSEEPKTTPYAHYADIITKKELFKIAREELKKNTGKDVLPQINPLEVLSNYSLSGVVSGQAPQAIIEDKKLRKTYFLSKGQSLGEFKIDDILEGKVILDFKGQKFELSL